MKYRGYVIKKELTNMDKPNKPKWSIFGVYKPINNQLVRQATAMTVRNAIYKINLILAGLKTN